MIVSSIGEYLLSAIFTWKRPDRNPPTSNRSHRLRMRHRADWLLSPELGRKNSEVDQAG